jgi:hypothetical protein
MDIMYRNGYLIRSSGRFEFVKPVNRERLVDGSFSDIESGGTRSTSQHVGTWRESHQWQHIHRMSGSTGAITAADVAALHAAQHDGPVKWAVAAAMLHSRE